MSHSAEQKRKKEEARAEALQHMNVMADGQERTMQPGNDFERPGERYYAEGGAVSAERLENEYEKSPSGGYTHKAKGTY